jgi:hypothetical protein
MRDRLLSKVCVGTLPACPAPLLALLLTAGRQPVPLLLSLLLSANQGCHATAGLPGT